MTEMERLVEIAAHTDGMAMLASMPEGKESRAYEAIVRAILTAMRELSAGTKQAGWEALNISHDEAGFDSDTPNYIFAQMINHILNEPEETLGHHGVKARDKA